MSGYNVWTKHGERGVMIEDGDEEENDDDNYRSMFPEYADTAMAMKKKEVKNGQHMSSLMTLVRSFLMQSETTTQKRRGCSSIRCYRTTTNCCTQLVKMARRRWVAHWNC